MPTRAKKVKIKGFLPRTDYAPMPVEGTVGYLLSPGHPDYSQPPEGKQLVEFRSEFKATDGCMVPAPSVEEDIDPIRLFIPNENIERLP